MGMRWVMGFIRYKNILLILVCALEAFYELHLTSSTIIFFSTSFLALTMKILLLLFYKISSIAFEKHCDATHKSLN